MIKPLAVLCFGVLLFGSAAAQTVYESKEGQGRVFSDRPTPGSKPVELRPLNVIEPLPVAPAEPKAAKVPSSEVKPPEPAALRYRSLAIVFPEAGGSVAANNATFEVRVSIDPPLQVGNGHAFVLRMDGRNVPGRYTSTEMMVPPEFFGDVMPAGAQRHVLEVSVIDAQGASVLTATPVDFQTRYVNTLQRPHSGGISGRPTTLPYPQPYATPKPVPKPVERPTMFPEPTVDSRPTPDSKR